MPPKRRFNDDDDEDYVDEADNDEVYDEFGKRKQVGSKGGTKKLRGGNLGRKTASSQYLDEASGPQFQDYSRSLELKNDHAKRPLWVTKDNLIILEAFSPIYKQAYDFVVAIAEPESRPEFIHCYKLTENSLYAAVAVFDTESIIDFLGRLCKTKLPAEVPKYIRDCTYTFGKAKIVLKDNQFYIESKHQEILRELLKNPIIHNARVLQPPVVAAPSTAATAAAAPNGSAVIDLTAPTNADGFIVSSGNSGANGFALGINGNGMFCNAYSRFSFVFFISHIIRLFLF
jgi:hypothetical protein